MDSLVVKLRKPGACDLSLEAATEIERLEAEAEHLRDLINTYQENRCACEVDPHEEHPNSQCEYHQNIADELKVAQDALALAIVNKDNAENQERLHRLELEKVQRQVTYIKAEFDDAWKKEVITVDLGSAILAAMPKEEE